MNNLLTVNNLSKTYKSGRGVRDVSFELQGGTILGIIGLNGAGKTTLLSCLTGFMEWDTGNILYTLSGKTYDNINKAPKILEDLGVLTTEYGFPPQFTAKTVNAIMSNIYQSWDKKKFFELLKELDLDPTVKVQKFSTGMKTKLGIAIALSHQAKILFLDEATNGLDVKASAKVREILYNHVADGENAIILTSHIMGEIERMSDAIMFIDDGNMKFNLNKDDLLHAYKAFAITAETLSKVDKQDVVKIKKDGYRIRVIAKEPKTFAKKYMLEPEVLPLDTIIEMFLEGEDLV